MPKSPITAIRKSKPRISSVTAEGEAQLAGHGVDADRGEREAEHHRRDASSHGGSLPMPMKLQNVRR